MAPRLLCTAHICFSPPSLEQGIQSPCLPLGPALVWCPVARADPVGWSLWPSLCPSGPPFLSLSSSIPSSSQSHSIGSTGCHCCNQPLPPSRNFRDPWEECNYHTLSQLPKLLFVLCVLYTMLRQISKLSPRDNFCPAFKLWAPLS